MPLVTEPVRCPQIQTERWLNGGPVLVGAGDVVLVDFWDYTCVNCLATLPYLRGWHARYHDLGFRIVGVHAPEFDFARSIANVERAIRELDITWPVALDNDYRTWQAYANRYWPAKYLADARGYLRYYHFGEGAYGETEAAIQALLHEIKPGIALPEPMAPVRDRDMPGAVCYRPTPELYLGYARGLFGRQEDIREDRPAVYLAPARRALGAAYLDGPWTVRQEYAEAEAGASLSVWYQAAEVNLVLHPGNGLATAELELDDAPVPPHLRGEDVHAEDGATVLTVAEPRMYRLIRGASFEEHELRLRARTPGLRAYAFTFVSCVKAEAGEQGSGIGVP
jgi:thiol-disulfide isomerase/thioredoxin